MRLCRIQIDEKWRVFSGQGAGGPRLRPSERAASGAVGAGLRRIERSSPLGIRCDAPEVAFVVIVRWQLPSPATIEKAVLMAEGAIARRQVRLVFVPRLSHVSRWPCTYGLDAESGAPHGAEGLPRRSLIRLLSLRSLVIGFAARRQARIRRVAAKSRTSQNVCGVFAEEPHGEATKMNRLDGNRKRKAYQAEVIHRRRA
jgi:hypothetical protein